MIIFRLSMPNCGSWNGKWSGQDRIYAKTRPNRLVPKELVDKDFYYNFGDGWCANISVEKVTSAEAKKIMKKSVGFYGYDWMIDSLIKNGEILRED